MKILLVNPPHPAIGSRIPREHLPPLGLLALGGPLLDAGHEVSLLDAEFEPLTVDRIVWEVRRRVPDAVLLGHSGSTSGHPVATRIARAVRAALPRAWIVYGGVFPTYHWSEIMEQEPAIDFIVRGEGEETMVRLIAALERGQALEEVPGIVFRAGSARSMPGSRCSLAAAPFPSPPLEERVRERRPSFSATTPDILVRQTAGLPPQTTAARSVGGLLSPTLSSKGGEGEPLARCSSPPEGRMGRGEPGSPSIQDRPLPDGRVVANPPAPPISDLDAHRIGWELIDHRRYTYWGNRRAVVVQFSRGCPHLCSYCGQREFWRTWRHRDPVNFAAELARLHREEGVEVINFADENPTASRAVWQTFLEALISHHVPLILVGSTRAGDIVRDADILHLYKRAGVARLLLGIESTDESTLQAIRKGSTQATDREAIRLLREHGIISMAGWVAGFAQETDRDYWRGLRQILYELWHWCFHDHRTVHGPTVAEFWENGGKASQPRLSAVARRSEPGAWRRQPAMST